MAAPSRQHPPSLPAPRVFLALTHWSTTTLPDTITLDPTKYDQEQINLMEERLILLDNDDHNIGEGSKKDCESPRVSLPTALQRARAQTDASPTTRPPPPRTGHLIPPSGSSETRSPLHRAFSVFLFHPETGKLLLQRRADEKITFPGMWTNTCCSHPLTSFGEMDEDGQIGARLGPPCTPLSVSQDADALDLMATIPTSTGVRRAAARKLVHELGIPTTYALDDFAYLTRIHYYAPSDDIWAEHESASTRSPSVDRGSLLLARRRTRTDPPPRQSTTSCS